MRSEPVIERVEATAYTVPTDGPEADGTLAWDSTGVVVVHVRAEGMHGVGWSYTSPAAAVVVRGVLADTVTGRTAWDVPGAHTAMRAAVRNIGQCGLVSTAVSAVDLALWDLKARLADLPLGALLGRVRDKVPVYGSGGFTTYGEERLGAQLEYWTRTLGIPRVKIKTGRGAVWDGRRAAFARRVVGEDVELFVDANGAYGTGEARRVGRLLADTARVAWFEEPVSSEDETGLALVRRAVQPDVAAGEYVWGPADARRLCAAGAVDCLQLDATRCGGVSGFLRCAAVAESFHLPVSAHCAPAAHLAVCSAVPNLRHLEFFHDHERIEGTFFTGIPRPGPEIGVPDERPGAGFELDGDAAARYVA